MKRRKYFRNYLSTPVPGLISISRINNNKEESSEGVIYLHDISAKGLSFASKLKFPDAPHVIYRFDINFYKERLELYGKIVWRKGYQSDQVIMYKYGVSLLHEQKRDLGIIIRQHSAEYREKYIRFYKGKSISQSLIDYVC